MVVSSAVVFVSFAHKIREHTGLLNMSLLVAGATPVGTWGPLALSAATPSTVNGVVADCWPFASSAAAEGLILCLLLSGGT